jgi:DNA primase
MSDSLALAKGYHRNLPAHVHDYLHQRRGISPEVNDLHLLGWNGNRITIPIFDQEGNFGFFKLAKDPEDKSDSPKMLATPGGHAELYGWERVLASPDQLIICEGEFDRLVLESRGFAAVTSTGGALTFRPEWTEVLGDIPTIYMCFDNDAAGREGAERVARLIPHARIVSLPKEVGEGGDVTDFFVRLGKAREEFQSLLDAAQALPPEKQAEPSNPNSIPGRHAPNDEVERLKHSVAIEDLIARYVELYTSGGNYRARCPFHDDRNPSFVVYPQTQRYYCFGCREHGDVLSVLMRQERLTFPEALQVLRELNGGETH